MPGIDTDLEALGFTELPARLARLLTDATAKVEAQAAEAGAEPEVIARKVGVLARTGAALVACIERLRRLRALSARGDMDETEEADMDDAEDPGAERALRQADPREAERLERDLRQLARNLQLGGGASGAVRDPQSADAGEAEGELGGAGLRSPVAA